MGCTQTRHGAGAPCWNQATHLHLLGHCASSPVKARPRLEPQGAGGRCRQVQQRSRAVRGVVELGAAWHRGQLGSRLHLARCVSSRSREASWSPCLRVVHPRCEDPQKTARQPVTLSWRPGWSRPMLRAGGPAAGTVDSHGRATTEPLVRQSDTVGAVACGTGRTHSRHRGCGCLGGPCALPAAPQTDCTMPTPDTQMLPRRGAGGHRSHRRKPSRPWIRRRSPGRDTGSAREPKERQRLHAAHLAARVVTFSRGAKLYPRMPDFL